VHKNNLDGIDKNLFFLSHGMENTHKKFSLLARKTKFHRLQLVDSRPIVFLEEFVDA
jgi:hypothetical protein